MGVPLIVVGSVEVNPTVFVVVVMVSSGVEGLTISTTEVVAVPTVVGTVVVNTGSVPEVTVIVLGRIDGSTT